MKCRKQVFSVSVKKTDQEKRERMRRALPCHAFCLETVPGLQHSDGEYVHESTNSALLQRVQGKPSWPEQDRAKRPNLTPRKNLEDLHKN